MINETEELPWELENAEEVEWYVPGNLNKLTAVFMTLGAFFALGLVLL